MNPKLDILLNHPLFLLLGLTAAGMWLMLERFLARRAARRQKAVIGVLRAVLILLLALCLADPRIRSRSDRVNLFFCLDLSESVGQDQRTAANRFMQRALAGMQGDDHAGLVLFGKQPSLETALSASFESPVVQSDIDPNMTNIAAALQLAAGRLPPKGKNKIVVFSDGNENRGGAVAAAHLAAALGVEIYPVALPSWFGQKEAYVKAVESPEVAALETPFKVRVVVVSAAPNRGELIIFRDGRLLANQPLELTAGKNVFTFSDALKEPGLYLYKAVINFPGDRFFQNNEGLSYTRGSRKSQILYLSGADSGQPPLAAALELQGLRLATRDVRELSGALHEMMEYNAVVLDNLSARFMPYTVMENIEKYVRDLGGGLIVIGGDQSYGAGHYGRTPLEAVLPVFIDPPTDLQFSQLCLILVIDKSSSMTTTTAGKSKLEMAKQAAFASIQMLNPTDSVGILVFDQKPTWSVPIMPAEQRVEIADRLSLVKEGGGTVLYPALEAAFEALQQTRASRKHVIVLSDGQTDGADFETLVQSMQAGKISVSTVSIGADSDRDLMQAIARWGQGRSYYTQHPDRLPEIFTGETSIVARNAITEKSLSPTRVGSDEMLRGIEGDLPALRGQVVTYPKPGAQVALKTSEGPLLAAWRYGLGRSVAYTSDLSPRWGTEWVQWPHYGRFVSQMVKWAQRRETQKNYAVDIARQGGTGTLTVDATSARNRLLNHQDLMVKIVLPSGINRTLVLDQIAPGRYQGDFPAQEIGTYYFSLFGGGSDSTDRPHVFGFGIPFTDEFARTDVNHHLLSRLADVSNGRVLDLDATAPDLFSTAGDSKDYSTALWPYLALAFLVLLMVDVAVRKVLNLA